MLFERRSYPPDAWRPGAIPPKRVTTPSVAEKTKDAPLYGGVLNAQFVVISK